jgi:hypothetical protein
MTWPLKSLAVVSFGLLAACSAEAKPDGDCRAEVQALRDARAAYGETRVPQLRKLAADDPSSPETLAAFGEFAAELDAWESRINMAISRCPAAAEEALRTKEEPPTVRMQPTSQQADATGRPND